MRNFSKNFLVLSPSDDISLRSFSLVGGTRPLHDLRWQVDGTLLRGASLIASGAADGSDTNHPPHPVTSQDPRPPLSRESRTMCYFPSPAVLKVITEVLPVESV